MEYSPHIIFRGHEKLADIFDCFIQLNVEWSFFLVLACQLALAWYLQYF